jgi:hypothetical protein
VTYERLEPVLSRALTEEESERLARYLAGDMSSEERRRTEHEILNDLGLAEALYSDVSLRESIAAVDDVTRARLRRERIGSAAGARWLRIALPAAAIVVLAALLPRFFQNDEDALRRLRSPFPAPSPIPAAPPTISAVFPTGTFDEPPPRFTWTSDPTATSYRLEIADDSGAILFTAETAETTLVFPVAELGSRTGTVLSWRVVPIAGTTAREPSSSLRFQIGP